MATEGADDVDWISSAENIEIDVNDFEAYVWPVFRERGYSKDTAILVWYLNMACLGINKLVEDDNDDG